MRKLSLLLLVVLVTSVTFLADAPQNVFAQVGGGQGGGNQGQGGGNQGQAGGQVQGGANQTAGTQATAIPSLIAPQGALVLSQASGANNTGGGVIVAPAGSTVFFQQNAQANANQNKTNTTQTTQTKTNTLAQVDDPLVQDLLVTIKEPTLDFRARTGAIDALSVLGADQTEMNKILNGLLETLVIEFPPDPNDVNLVKKRVFRDQLENKNTGESKLICLHVVEALGNLGWGARAAIGRMQPLRGQDVILDTAITNAVAAIKAAPQPQTTNQNNTNMGNNPMTQPTTTTTPQGQ